MNFYGVILGAVTFLIIGLFHPLVIKAEYYLGTKSWIIFCVAGLLSIVFSFLVQDKMLSASLGVLGFTCLWSIKEVFEQEQRVKDGRFPKNPKRHK